MTEQGHRNGTIAAVVAPPQRIETMAEYLKRREGERWEHGDTLHVLSHILDVEETWRRLYLTNRETA